MRAAYVAKQLDEKYPSQVDPWAVVPWGALREEGYNNFPQYIRSNKEDSEAHKYDTEKNPPRVRRISILSETEAPLPPALPSAPVPGQVRDGSLRGLSLGTNMVSYCTPVNKLTAATTRN